MDFLKLNIVRFYGLPLIGLFTGVALSFCGAPSKSASDVADIFKQDESLGAKVFTLCAGLSNREQPPNLKNPDHITEDECKGAGRDAQHMNNLISKKDQQLNFIGFSTESISGDKPAFKVRTRMELWLNKSIVGVVTLFSSSMQGMAGTSTAPGAEIDLFGSPSTTTTSSGNETGIEDVKNVGVYPKAIFRESPVFNKETGEFHLAVNISTTGQIVIDNDFYVDGGFYDGAIAVSVETREDQIFEKSLIRSIKALAVIMPYDSDIYIDVSISMTLNSIGVDPIYDTQIRLILGSIANIVVNKLKEMEKGK